MGTLPSRHSIAVMPSTVSPAVHRRRSLVAFGGVTCCPAVSSLVVCPPPLEQQLLEIYKDSSTATAAAMEVLEKLQRLHPCLQLQLLEDLRSLPRSVLCSQSPWSFQIRSVFCYRRNPGSSHFWLTFGFLHLRRY